MRKVYHLKTCSTCIRIIKELQLKDSFELQDIKSNPITSEQIEEMAQLSGSYEALFSKNALKYKSMGLKNKFLTESDLKSLILEEYTFLKRPVVILNDRIFIGNSSANVATIKNALTE